MAKVPGELGTTIETIGPYKGMKVRTLIINGVKMVRIIKEDGTPLVSYSAENYEEIRKGIFNHAKIHAAYMPKAAKYAYLYGRSLFAKLVNNRFITPIHEKEAEKLEKYNFPCKIEEKDGKLYMSVYKYSVTCTPEYIIEKARHPFITGITSAIMYQKLYGDCKPWIGYINRRYTFSFVTDVRKTKERYILKVLSEISNEFTVHRVSDYTLSRALINVTISPVYMTVKRRRLLKKYADCVMGK